MIKFFVEIVVTRVTVSLISFWDIFKQLFSLESLNLKLYERDVDIKYYFLNVFDWKTVIELAEGKFLIQFVVWKLLAVKAGYEEPC